MNKAMQSYTPRLLIVDDAFAERLPMRAVLEQEGFDIDEAESGHEALEMLNKGRYDGIILDVVMPTMNGFETCREIRKLASGRLIPVLMVTGLDDHASITEAYNAGATDFLTKPVNWDLVGHRVRYLLRSSRLAQDLDLSQQELVEKQELLDAFINNSPAAISIKGLDRKYKMANPEFIRHCVYKDKNIFGSTDHDLFHKGFSNQVMEHDDLVLKEKSPKRFEEHCMEDGCNRVHFSVRFPIMNAQGEATGVGCISTDITESKKTQESLLLARRVIESTNESIMITDPNGVILDVNSAFEEMTEFGREEAIGNKPSLLKSGRHAVDFYKEMWETLLLTGQWEGEVWDRRKSGDVFPKRLAISAVKNSDGMTQYYVGISTDITTQKATEEKLQQLAFFDPLTNLPNRTLFRDRLTHEIDQAARRKDQFAVLFIDLDRFKHVNDSLGHDVGDELLIQVSKRIEACLRRSDTVARLGGDEFTVILSTESNPHIYAQIAEKIISELRQPFHIRDRQLYIGASIGIVSYPAEGLTYEQLTKNADTAMYRAKAAGGSSYRFFSSEMDEENMSRLSLEEELHMAMERDELALHYQPKVDLVSNSVVGVEALIRWYHPSKGTVSPVQFIPLAEENGLIIPIGQWVLETACQQARTWLDQGIDSVRVAVNLSGRQFQNPNLLDEIQVTLDRFNLPRGSIELEITESVAMDDVEKTVAIVERMRAMGLHISVDDFGTGYSSLSYLKKLPLDCLKVDQSFVRDLMSDSDDAAIVDSIISLARSMNLSVVAEGVETLDQLSFLKEKDCDEVQGYFFSKPLPAEAMTQLILNPALTLQAAG
ncbi:EAL domain-containing protein [Magnetococcus sp. PR-3]|uniref:EAL domain-containing protein n=1 Tax=Magnetococcus sp. PR-3 TaxID=3120355 RepID=UPI002FCE4AEE